VAVGEDRIREVVEYFLENGEEATCEAFGLTAETLHRYKRDYKAILGDAWTQKKLLSDIGDKYSDAELRAIAKGGSLPGRISPPPPLRFDGETVTFLYMTDTHIGSKYFQENHFFSALEVADELGIDTILHGGDVVEGMSRRDGHIYELDAIGYDEQKHRERWAYRQGHLRGTAGR